MRGCVKAVLSLLVLLLSIDATADCSWTPQQSADLRSTALDVAVDGETVWVATGYGVQVVADGREIAATALPGMTTTVLAGGNGFVYAGSGSRVFALRRIGSAIQIAGSVATSGTVNDLEFLGGYLFVATSNGLDHLGVFDPANPVDTGITLHTSSQNVTSLAVVQSTLFAADGDATLERFAVAVPSLPQNTGSLETLPVASAVHATPNGLVLVSDRFGQNTDVFSGSARVARLETGATSFAAGAGQPYFLAGPDRVVRAVDVSSLASITQVFQSQVPATDGTENAIHAMARSGDVLYVAAGDAGLVTFDVSTIRAPYPFAAYATGASTSLTVSGDMAFFASQSSESGRIAQVRVSSAGPSLTEERGWAVPVGTFVHDLANDLLLTSAGPALSVWSINANPPAAVQSATLAGDVRTAVWNGSSPVVLLGDGSVWRVNGSTPERVNVPPMAALARAGSALLLAEVRQNDGTTVLHYYADGNLAGEPRRFTVDGALIGNVALDAARAAVYTFNGASVIDLSSGATRVVQGSNLVIAREIAFAGDDLLLHDGRRLLVFDGAETLVREHALPADAAALRMSGSIAVIATSRGQVALRYDAGVPGPSLHFMNSFYTSMAAAGDRIYALHRDGVEVFAVTSANTLRHETSIREAGLIGVAATATALYTLGGDGAVTRWSRAGARGAETVITDGFDSTPLSIHTAGNAVWASFMTGCTSGGCQRKTVVLDPHTLAGTALLTGSVRDVSARGTRTYALFDGPNEMRVYDTTDPLRPNAVAAAARPASATSIAHDGDAVAVLGDRLYSFTDTTLSPAGERLDAAQPRPQQRVRVAEGCGIITGRGEQPLLFSLPSWTESAAPTVPAAVQTLAIDGNRVVILTSHSIEIWSAVAPAPGRRRAVR